MIALNKILSTLRNKKIKVWTEEGELKYKAPRGALDEETRAALKENKAAIIKHLESIETKALVKPIVKISRNENLPLSYIQQGIWYACQFKENASLYNMVMAFEMSGELEFTVFQSAINKLIDRHEILRTNFLEIEGEVKQIIHEERPVKVYYEEYTHGAESAKAVFENRLSKEKQHRFDLINDPLFNIGLVKLEDTRWYVWLNIHHIISDGWSSNVFFAELIKLYTAEIKNAETTLTPLAIQYADYSAWQRDQLSGESYEKLLNFWKNNLAGIPELLQIPNQKARTTKQTYKSAVVSVELNTGTTKEFLDHTNKLGLTPFMAFLSVFSQVIAKYTRQNDIVIGTASANRSNTQVQSLIGCFVNVLPLRILVDPSFTFDQFASSLKQNMLDCYNHQEMPFDKLVNELNPKRNLSYNPIAQVMFNMNTTVSEKINMDGFSLLPFETEAPAAGNYDLQLEIKEKSGFYSAQFTYNDELFDQHFIEGFASHYTTILSNCFRNPEINISEMNYLSPQETNQLLFEFNDTQANYPQHKTLISLFEEQVLKTPDEIALVFQEKELSYRDLNEMSNALGNYLRKQYDVKPDDLIGLKLERSEWMIISILGVLKSGGAYVPIDPEYPEDRVTYMVSDSRCKILIDENELIKFHKEKNKFSTENLPVVNKPNDLAYVIYTSGSTGKPKGCMLEHKGVINRIEWMWKAYNYSREDIILQKTTFTFDVSVWEIFMPLCWGAKMVLCCKEDIGSPQGILKLIEAQKITCLHFVPSMLNAFIADLFSETEHIKSLASLRRVITSGEALSAETVKKWYAKTDIVIHNLYGPTEASVDVTHYSTNREDTHIPIGRPVWNTQMYVLDEQLQLVPVGVTGELCIGGDGLARGYLNKPELTEEKFIQHPFKPNERIYKTGDLAKWTPDGTIDFLGRKDDQVKIRGYRIELGEIEDKLLNHPLINAAVVLAKSNQQGEKELIAYIVSKENFNSSTLRTYLNTSLPLYMIPAHFVALETLPLTPNGKADRKAISQIDSLGLARETEYIQPKNEVQERLVRIWQDVLAIENIGINADFFELGGHSLKAIMLLNHINKGFEVKLSLKELLENLVLEDQAQLIQNAKKIVHNPIVPAPVQPSYPLSSSQRRMWTLSQFEEGNIAYNIPGVFVFEGLLNKAALEHSFKKLIERHEILRTLFVENEQGEVRQLVYPYGDSKFKINYHDLMNQQEQEATLKERIQTECNASFGLASGPLLRASLYGLANNKWVFTFIMHHIISDGWSMDILLKELLMFYHSYSQKTDHLPEPLAIQYKDYASWEQEQLKGDAINDHKEYWINQFKGGLPVLELPVDRPRPAIKTYNGGVISGNINPQISKGLKELCNAQDSTLFMGLLASVNVLLNRYTNQEDIIIGSPIANREHADLENQIGLYLNTLALRTNLKGKDSYIEVLKNVKDNTLDAYKNQAYPFDELVNELNLTPDRSRSILFDVMIDLKNNESTLDTHVQHIGDLKISNYEGSEYVISKFDLAFNFEDSTNGIDLLLGYNNDILNKETAQRLVQHFTQLIDAIVEFPGHAINTLDYIGKEERQELLVNFNNTALAFPKDKTIVGLFEEQVAKTPDNIALVFEEKQFSYKELNEKSNQLSSYLRTKYKIEPDDLVGIKSERNELLIISILAVLKSGGAYIPIDPEYPQERIDFMISDSNCKLVLDEEELQLFTTKRAIYSKANSKHINKSSDLAYVIYTSGSTGKPKGVMVEHQSLVNLCSWHIANFGVTETDHASVYANQSFDASVWEIFPYLVSGASLYIIPKEIRLDIPALTAYFEANKISISFLPTKVGEQFFEVENNSLRYLLVGGDKLNSFVNKNYRIVNNYGPTENTVVTTSIVLGTENKNIPIGSPISNTSVYILDKQNQLCPIGVIGEICISGESLARGYLNQPDLTAEKFVTNPFKEGERMYKSGDMGRWGADGTIEFAGRKDDQVKIRGYRIELGEVENALQQQEDVDAVVVIARANADGYNELVAYVVSKITLNTSVIGSYLSTILPAYMIPGHFIQLEAFPLTPNGKIDKKMLAGMDSQGMSTGLKYIAPTNKTEEVLVAIWQELLDKEKIGIEDNFFEIGGHSLKATRIISGVYKQLNRKITLKNIFLQPTIRQLAQLIQSTDEVQFTDIPKLPLQEDYELSHSQQRIWVLEQLVENSLAYVMPMAFEITGKLDAAAMNVAFQKIVKRHESLRTVFINKGGYPRQVIKEAEELQFALELKDLTGIANAELLIEKQLKEDSSSAFDLEKGPLLRGVILKINENKTIFSFSMHHIISDGWSLDVFVKELMHFYHHVVSNTEPALPALRIHYKDFSGWQNKQLLDKSTVNSRKYWLSKFEGEIPVLNLPADYSRVNSLKNYGQATIVNFDKELAAKVYAYCKKEDVSNFIFLLALVKTLLFRYTGQKDIVIGTPVAGRNHPDLEDQIGVFINTLPLKSALSADKSFSVFLSELREQVTDAYHHQDYPFDKLVDELNLERDNTRNPLFDVLIRLDILDDNKHRYAGLEIKLIGEGSGVSNFDLVFNFELKGEELKMVIGSNTALYKPETVERMGEHLLSIASAVIGADKIVLGDINYLSDNDHHLLSSFNNNKAACIQQTIDQLATTLALNNPNGIAIQQVDQTLTYKQLHLDSNRIAAYLHSNNAQPEEVIAVIATPGIAMIKIIVGVLKSNCAYLPIDADLPEERIKFMLQNAGVKKIVLDKKEYISKFKLDADQCRVIDAECKAVEEYSSEDLHLEKRQDQLACVYYTSGSTGIPKGVMLQHDGLVNRIAWFWKNFECTAKDVYLFKTPFTFDVSMSEMFMPVCFGCKMLILEEHTILNPHELSRAIDKYGITITHFSPTVLNSFLETLDQEEFLKLDSLRYVLSSGEALPRSVVQKYYAGMKAPLVNLYGPTEASIEVSWHVCSSKDESIPIGKPIVNVGLHILDDKGREVAIGVEGEICISGIALARGYLNNPLMTAERFVSVEINKKATLVYKTGDVGKWNDRGEVEYLGRKDNQVNLGGYRIELGEIEQNLSEYASVSNSCVTTTAGNDGSMALTAYIIKKTDAHELPEEDAVDPSGTTDEKELLTLSEFNSAYRTYDQNKLVQELFEQQAAVAQGEAAVFFKENKLSYGELNTQANQLANGLREKHAVKPQDKIIILAERSERLFVAMLGVLKSGATFIPLDPENPTDRIASIIEDCGCNLVLTDKVKLVQSINNGITVININQLQEDFKNEEDVNPSIVNQFSDAAYIIYTSGTTGKPKGVVVEHRNLCSITAAWITDYRLNTFKPHVLQVASMAFDVFIGDVCRSLLAGGCITLCPSDLRFDLDYLAQTIYENKITVFESTPGLIVPLIQSMAQSPEKLACMKLLIMGSDALYAKDYEAIRKQLPPACRLINSYGTTETSIDSCFYEGGVQEKKQGQMMPIGKPMSNTYCYILNKNKEQVGIGVVAELYIGGNGVSRGYINNTALTGERFISDPFNKAARLYKTGDLAYWLPDGNIQFIGRSDHQVKIRGYRIELDEVQGAVENYPDIERAVVIALKEEGNNSLMAYFQSKIVIEKEKIIDFLAKILPAYMIPSYFMQVEEFPLTKNGKLDRSALPKPLVLQQSFEYANEIRTYLRGRLPGYMVPTNIVVMAKFPLTSSGKTDRKNLPHPSNLLSDNQRDCILPRTKAEEQQLKIWQEVLLLDKISVTDNFFDLGGHSLRGIQLIYKLNKATGTSYRLADLFNFPTIEKLAAAAKQTVQDQVIRFGEMSEEKPALFMIPPVTGSATVFSPLAAVLNEQFNCYGIQYSGLEKGEQMDNSIEAIAERFSTIIKQLNKTKKCYLLGYSMGALVAFEIAKQLEREGIEINLQLVDREASGGDTFLSFFTDENIDLEIERQMQVHNFVSDAGIRATYSAMYKNNLKLVSEYKLEGIIHGDLTVFEARGNERRANMNDWKKNTGGHFSYIELTGNHEQVFEKDNIRIIESKVRIKEEMLQ